LGRKPSCPPTHIIKYTNMTHPLFAPYQLGDLTLPNRIVMVPLTRNRANLDGDTPSAMHADYYAQRATAGLIISEGAQISAQGKGYFRTPGIYTEAQVAAWRKITEAVHQRRGRIFCQLWHVGRMSHTSFQPDGAAPVAPSAIKADAQTFAEGGMIDVSIPRAVETVEISEVIEDYRRAAACAKRAGFDGIELHAANGYLLDQFFREASNKRQDDYGGSVENRTRIHADILDALIKIWPAGRIGVRYSPFSHAGDAQPNNPMDTYLHLIEQANAAGVAYVHLIEGETGGERTANFHDLKTLKDAVSGVYMANNGYDRRMALDAVTNGNADLICFGRPFIANPDLVSRLEKDAPLNTPNPDTFYGGDREGYTDYPFLTSPLAA